MWSISAGQRSKVTKYFTRGLRSDPKQPEELLCGPGSFTRNVSEAVEQSLQHLYAENKTCGSVHEPRLVLLLQTEFKTTSIIVTW